MKLYYTPASPYARKVRIVAREKGIEKRIEEVLAHPIDSPGDLNDHNPLGKIPALVLDNGYTLCDSPLICQYLDTLSPHTPLFPTDHYRWEVLNRMALAHGMTDAAVLLMHESRREKGTQSKLWTERHTHAIGRTLKLLDAHPPKGNEINIATITLASTLGYLLFRMPVGDWRDGYPALAGWYETFSKRPSMQAVPHS